MDQFVGNTLEKAITRRRRAQREAMAAAAGANKEAVMTYGELRLGQTAAAGAAAVVEPDKTVTVTKIPSHTLKVTTPGGSLVVNGGGGKGSSDEFDTIKELRAAATNASSVTPSVNTASATN